MTISNALIEGNIFTYGTATPDGTAVTSYTYDSLLFTTADCKIVNNNFSGIAGSTSKVMVNLNNCTCNISGNMFVRDTNTILAYITSTGSKDQVIVDNIFDSFTVDGTVENLVTGITDSSIYEENKNQTGYLVLSLLDGQMAAGANAFASETTANTVGVNNPGGTIYDAKANGFVITKFATGDSVLDLITPTGNGGSSYIFYEDTVSGGVPAAGPRTFSKIFNLNKDLPRNVNVIEAKIGTWKDTGLPFDTSSVANNQFILKLISYNDTLTSNSVNGILDVKSNIDAFDGLDLSERYTYMAYLQIGTASGPTTTIDVPNNVTYTAQVVPEASLIAATQYISVAPTNGLYCNVSTRRISIVYELFFRRGAGASGTIDVYNSPIRIKYRW